MWSNHRSPCFENWMKIKGFLFGIRVRWHLVSFIKTFTLQIQLKILPFFRFPRNMQLKVKTVLRSFLPTYIIPLRVSQTTTLPWNFTLRWKYVNCLNKTQKRREKKNPATSKLRNPRKYAFWRSSVETPPPLSHFLLLVLVRRRLVLHGRATRYTTLERRCRVYGEWKLTRS